MKTTVMGPESTVDDESSSFFFSDKGPFPWVLFNMVLFRGNYSICLFHF
jgi:hypothetical protein